MKGLLTLIGLTGGGQGRIDQSEVSMNHSSGYSEKLRTGGENWGPLLSAQGRAQGLSGQRNKSLMRGSREILIKFSVGQDNGRDDHPS